MGTSHQAQKHKLNITTLPQTLKNILTATWGTKTDKIVTLKLYAVVTGEETETVDVRTAATELIGEDGWSGRGQAGIMTFNKKLEELMKEAS